MHGVAIELRVGCAGCGQPIPINAYTPRITCSSCNRTAEMSDERWHGLLEDAVDEAPEMGVDEGSSTTIMTGGGTYNLMYGNQAPRCQSCKTPVPEGAAALAHFLGHQPIIRVQQVECGRVAQIAIQVAQLIEIDHEECHRGHADQLPRRQYLPRKQLAKQGDGGGPGRGQGVAAQVMAKHCISTDNTFLARTRPA